MSVALVFETHSMSVDNETGHATGWLDLRAGGRMVAGLAVTLLHL
jgi:hypothetical protein